MIITPSITIPSIKTERSAVAALSSTATADPRIKNTGSETSTSATGQNLDVNLLVIPFLRELVVFKLGNTGCPVDGSTGNVKPPGHQRILLRSRSENIIRPIYLLLGDITILFAMDASKRRT
jgi:hypothetical protein